jgi:hypothetical protein
VKKTTAILFIILLLSAQYARQLSYMGCKLFYSSVANDCGCEKILDTKTEPKTDTSSATVHKHLHIDDFIKRFTLKTTIEVSSFRKEKKYFVYSSPLNKGIINSLFHPPNA